MNDKPNLVLTEKDLLEGAKNPNADFSKKLQKDLISLFEFLIENQNDIKVNLEVEEQHNCILCGIHRNISGWWAYWLDIPIHVFEPAAAVQDYELSDRFKNAMYDDNIWQGFAIIEKQIDAEYFYFFGDNTAGSLEDRLELAKALQIK